MRKLRAIDLCCGAGGWACAARSLPIEFVAVADISPVHLETWRQNHARDHVRCARVECDLSSETGAAALLAALPSGDEIDVLLGGIPCEPVSQAAGRGSAAFRKTPELARWHALIDMVLSLVRAIGPRWWAIEDVVPVLRHLPAPLELGWTIPYRKVHAHHFGPQKRYRVFLGRFPAPSPPREPSVLGDCLLPGPHNLLRFPERFEHRGGRGRGASRVGRTVIRVLDPSQPCPAILGSHARGSRQRRSYAVREHGRLRQLSLAERARVQGFPEDYVFDEALTIASKQIGQAIPVYVGRAILQAIVVEAELEEEAARA